ncbi:MAG: BamA/TamA family outer membrane protein [Bacteroidota bacterium]
MKNALSIYCILFSFSFAQEITVPSFSFPDSTYRVGAVIIIGNELTKQYIIEHEMVLKQDSLITHQGVQYDINRIYSLRLFTKVDITVVPDSKELATLIVRVNERWYFYPFPVVGIKDRDFTKIYYGAGIIHNNVAGENVQMFGSFAFGYDPYISIGYTNPLVDIENRIFFSLRAYYTEQRNRSLLSLAGSPNFDEIRSGGSIGVGKRSSLFTTVAMSVEYLNLRVTDNRAGRTLSPSGRDEFFSLHASYLYDTRDLREYPSEGTVISLGVSKHGVFENDVDYQRYNVDVRKYLQVTDDLVLAGRLFSSLSGGGSVPNYGHVFFGYLEQIRGHFKTVREGEQIVGSVIEAHYPIVSPRYIRLDFLPFEQFRDVRYALYFALFADAGNTWYRSEPLALNTFSSGYGAGVHLHLAYSAVARIEFGIPYGKPFSKGEIILDLGAAL